MYSLDLRQIEFPGNRLQHCARGLADYPFAALAGPFGKLRDQLASAAKDSSGDPVRAAEFEKGINNNELAGSGATAAKYAP